MLHIALGAVIIGGVVLALLGTETRNQHARFQRKESQLRQETAQQRANIQAAMVRSAAYQEYRQYIEMHYASVQTANQAYDLYASAKHVIDQLYNQLNISGEQIMLLKQQRQLQNGIDREVTHQILQQQYDIHHELKRAIEGYKQQKNAYYQEIKMLNEATAQLKQYIRHHTGQAGREWYARLQQRQV
ncbi:hypothetical protein RFI02_12065 [Acinetobacter sichuanensis]|uniref:hypothetical protein n=1 Tax=Acinetobacter sichuanensis TaxID=2136183 RepID=UPI00280E5A33|nr:hypothetical protein [Acinetobacter sichuanensis]MDQ9021841.1 hypothetical protein [Acinetobacter sichuanensis]